MKILLIFDIAFDKRKAGNLKFKAEDDVFLFPLTSSTDTLEEIMSTVKDCGARTQVIPSGEGINRSAEKLRKKFINFIGTIPELVKVNNKGLKDYFKIDSVASLWWFSMIAEKNVYKSDSFNCLAQLDSIINAVKDNSVDMIIFSGRSNKLAVSLAIFSKKNKIRLKKILVKGDSGPVQRFIQLQGFFYFKHLSLLCVTGIKTFAKFIRIKMAFNSRITKTSAAYRQMIITYFPNMDMGLAEKGVFNNRYYPHLQAALELKNENLVWIVMYVPGTGVSFGKSIEYAKKFTRNGNKIYFLEEFSSAGLQLSSFFFMLKESFRFLRIQKEIEKIHDLDGYNFYALFKDDWFSSFCGAAGYEGLLYYGCFSKMFRSVKLQKCLYYCEMHAWENALVSARNSIDPNIRLFAYQHAMVPRMILNYFKDPVEFKNDDAYTMPLPEKIICNGQFNFRCLKESGYPGNMLAVAEAIRYNHLKLSLGCPNNGHRNIVLIVLSISAKESSSLLSVAYQALKDMRGVTVWVKPHPFLSADKVFKEALLDRSDFDFEIKEGNLSECLKDAKVVIVGESSVALEALASGCRVISVNVPEWINMSPLSGIVSESIRVASSSGELRSMVEELLNDKSGGEMNLLSTKHIIDDFFYLSKDTDVPKRLLEILEN